VHTDEGRGLARRHVLALLGGGILGGPLAAPAGADTALDVRILQTASSLEALAEAACARLPADGLSGFARDAGRRHAEHKQAFQSQTSTLGGRSQDAPNPRFLLLLEEPDPLAAAATIEKVLVDTYISNLTVAGDRRARELLAAAMAGAAQHLAVFRVAGALAAPGSTQPLAVPLPVADLPKLPSTVGTVAPPEALHAMGGPELIADPASGALG